MSDNETRYRATDYARQFYRQLNDPETLTQEERYVGSEMRKVLTEHDWILQQLVMQFDHEPGVTVKEIRDVYGSCPERDDSEYVVSHASDLVEEMMRKGLIEKM
jgi:hypothetical protein